MLSTVRILRQPTNRVYRLLSRTMSSKRMAPTPWTPNNYPPARRSNHVDEYKSELKGQVKVADPYQWLEKSTPETDEWVTAQEEFTRAYLDQASVFA